MHVFQGVRTFPKLHSKKAAASSPDLHVGGGEYIPSLGWLCLALEIGWGAQTCRESSELLFLHVERGQLGHKMRISSRRAQTKGEPGVDPEFAERLYVSPGLEMPLSRPKSGGEKVNLGYLQKFLYRNK